MRRLAAVPFCALVFCTLIGAAERTAWTAECGPLEHPMPPFTCDTGWAPLQDTDAWWYSEEPVAKAKAYGGGETILCHKRAASGAIATVQECKEQTLQKWMAHVVSWTVLRSRLIV